MSVEQPLYISQSAQSGEKESLISSPPLKEMWVSSFLHMMCAPVCVCVSAHTRVYVCVCVCAIVSHLWFIHAKAFLSILTL